MSKENIHPYVPSSGILVQTFAQFRKMFPQTVDSTTLQKLSLAPKNESVVITTFRFLRLIDENGKKTEAASVFLIHDNQDFFKEFRKIVQKSYKELFDQFGEESWNLDRNTLINFFRVNDETSEITAKRQAITFETLSALPEFKESKKTKPKKSIPKKKEVKKIEDKESDLENLGSQKSNLGLTVRIEINLPSQGDQKTYDNIFKSIKENLLS